MKMIYEVLYGSDAYGTTTADSDNDIRGIYLPTLEECLSLKPLEDIRNHDDKEDRVIYPIQKFFSLALNSNPSVFEWLFVKDTCIKIMEPAGKVIRDNRLLFMSQNIYVKFKGFAYSEFSSLTKLTGETGEKRREQILTYGYSPKNAMNCIRLLQQGVEMLKDCHLSMPRPNAQELIEIKKGKLKYETIANMFDDLLKQLDIAMKTTRLPEKPRWDDANNLMIRIIKDFNWRSC